MIFNKYEKIIIFLPEHAENFIEKNTEIIEKYA